MIPRFCCGSDRGGIIRAQEFVVARDGVVPVFRWKVVHELLVFGRIYASSSSRTTGEGEFSFTARPHASDDERLEAGGMRLSVDQAEC